MADVGEMSDICENTKEAQFSLLEKRSIILLNPCHRRTLISRTTAQFLLGCCAALAASASHAQQCPAPTFVYTPGAAVIQGEDAPIQALADSVESKDGVVSLDGNTTITWQGRRITAENASYNTETGEVEIEGDLSFAAEGIQLESKSAEIDLDDNRFRSGESSYEIDLNGKRATGRARSMERLDDGSFVMEAATYTSCPKLDNSWFVKANRIELYPDDGLGIAKNVVLRFKGVPFLAVPVFSFPISPDRKTGFLAPVFARGDNTGIEMQLPWYWNIRPNLDATFTPRWMSKRGIQLNTELRYLNRIGTWTLDNEIMSDRTFEGSRRRLTQVRHDGQIGPFWRSSISASQVSDKSYFQDLGNSLEVTSITHLERRADVTYEWANTKIEARLQSFQTVDQDIPPNERPYQRLPQFTFSTIAPSRPFGLLASFDSEAVFFDRDSSVTGLRIDTTPRLSLPISASAWFLKPSISHRFTHYRLNDVDSVAGQSSRQSRNLNTVSVDGGLFFDRLLDDDGSVLTLEPRAYYLRVPFEDQSELPVFDSNAFDFNIAQLFRENRFTGGDRVSDANQLSLAVTSRLINGNDGREVLRGSIGQIFYFDDRRVALANDDTDTTDPANTIDTRDTSDFVGELAGEFRKSWRAKGSIQFNPDEDRSVRSSLLLSYRPDDTRIVNIAHRNVSTRNSADTEQVDLSVLWPIRDQWRLAARWNYALDNNISIQSLLGVQYDSCCWAMRFAATRRITDSGEDHDTTLYLQLVLKGLAPLGRDYGGLLEDNILGYRDELE